MDLTGMNDDQKRQLLADLEAKNEFMATQMQEATKFIAETPGLIDELNDLWRRIELGLTEPAAMRAFLDQLEARRQSSNDAIRNLQFAATPLSNVLGNDPPADG